MAQPCWTSLDPLTVTDGVLDIGRGNWQPGQAQEPLPEPRKWMPVVHVDGEKVRGETPGMPSVPATTTYKGEVSWDKRISYDLKPAYSDGKQHQIKVWVYAASFFDGWGDHPEDAWEWGHYQSADMTTPAVLAMSFKIGGEQPIAPPPTPDTTWALTKNAQEAMIDEWESQGITASALSKQRIWMDRQLADKSQAWWNERIRPLL